MLKLLYRYLEAIKKPVMDIAQSPRVRLSGQARRSSKVKRRSVRRKVDAEPPKRRDSSLLVAWLVGR